MDPEKRLTTLTLDPRTSTGIVVVGLLLRSVRVFEHFAWLEVGSRKVALPRPRRAPCWCPICPTSIPKGHTQRVLRKRKPLGSSSSAKIDIERLLRHTLFNLSIGF